MIHLAVCDSREDRKWLKDALETFRAGEREIDASFYENAEDLARDLEIFQQEGYRVEIVKLMDMFPRTVHVETVALLKKV